ncbi:MAG: competence/damage-inducible protein A [Planctomycetes bacterium]|nr:competence/damage-inducible protein A [Planctomycetota bacterium]
MNDRTAIIFCMGRELLEGMVLDRNAHFMTGHVSRLGFRVRTIQVLDEVEEEVVQAFRGAVAARPRYVLVTGGMGPGLDDITRECLAKAAGVPLVVDERAREFLAAAYRRLLAKGVVDDVELTPERLKMATVPQGSEVFDNPSGTAPAVRFETAGVTFFLLPGQPEELRRLFTLYVEPHLEQHGATAVREVVHIDYPGGDESMISRLLGDLARRHPHVHSRARLQGTEDNLTIRISLSVEGTDAEQLRKQLDSATADLRARLGLEVTRGQRSENA